jgi:hypothetical protein
VYPRKRATDLKAEIPHIRLEDFRKPAPAGWSGRVFTVDQLPDDQPAVVDPEPEPEPPVPPVPPAAKRGRRSR